MAQRRFHYEQAFEHYLRCNRVPYVAVDEARKALTRPDIHPDTVAGDALKSFDFVVYSPEGNLLLDVKGRKCAVRWKRPAPAAPRRPAARLSGTRLASGRTGRLESWVTDEDVQSLGAWAHLFGSTFRAVFVFMYWCESQPPDSLFQEVFEFGGRWYVLRCVDLCDYRRFMVRRSERWGTWCVPAEAFAAISRPFAVHRLLGASSGAPAPPDLESCGGRGGRPVEIGCGT